MVFKISRQQMEHGLDALIVQLAETKSLDDFRRFKSSLNIFEKLGYNVDKYRALYDEIKNEVEEYNRGK
jgi:hypothetical protein